MAKQHSLLSDLAAIEQQLTQLAQGANLYSVEQPHGVWSPPVDIYETPTGFVLTAEVPGVQGSEIDIKVVDGILILRGERRWERDVPGEVLAGAFQRIRELDALCTQLWEESQRRASSGSIEAFAWA